MDLKTVVMQGVAISNKYKSEIDDLSTPYSIDDIQRIIENDTGIKINLFTLDWNSNDIIKGKLCRYTTHANIYFLTRDVRAPKVTLCEQRFIATKEMAHLIIDTETSYTQDIEELIRSILYQKPNLSDDNEVMQSEVLAEVVAAELLFPWMERDEQIALLDAKKIESIDIAEKYKLPLKIVDWMLSKNNHKIIGDIVSSIS